MQYSDNQQNFLINRSNNIYAATKPNNYQNV